MLAKKQRKPNGVGVVGWRFFLSPRQGLTVGRGSKDDCHGWALSLSVPTGGGASSLGDPGLSAESPSAGWSADQGCASARE